MLVSLGIKIYIEVVDSIVIVEVAEGNKVLLEVVQNNKLT